MTGRERVSRAIEFRSPDRVPVWFFNRDHLRGDIMCYGLGRGIEDRNEWGYRMKNLGDGTMGQPEAPVLPTWDTFNGFRAPELAADVRMQNLKEFKERAGDRYMLGGLGITGFNLYTFLRGFGNSMMDFLAEQDRACSLLDMIFDFEMQLISLSAEAKLDGVHFADDWGTQQGLMIAPELWRMMFKPRYRKQFEHAHRLGLHVWFHSCGNVASILPDLREIGLDVMNISQPNVVDIAGVAGRLGGRQCFMVPTSYQTVSIKGTPAEIRAEARRLYDALATPQGGFIGYVEEYKCMGMSEENYQACARAFEALT